MDTLTCMCVVLRAGTAGRVCVLKSNINSRSAEAHCVLCLLPQVAQAAANFPPHAPSHAGSSTQHELDGAQPGPNINLRLLSDNSSAGGSSASVLLGSPNGAGLGLQQDLQAEGSRGSEAGWVRRASTGLRDCRGIIASTGAQAGTELGADIGAGQLAQAAAPQHQQGDPTLQARASGGQEGDVRAGQAGAVSTTGGQQQPGPVPGTDAPAPPAGALILLNAGQIAQAAPPPLLPDSDLASAGRKQEGPQPDEASMPEPGGRGALHAVTGL